MLFAHASPDPCTDIFIFTLECGRRQQMMRMVVVGARICCVHARACIKITDSAAGDFSSQP